MKKIGRPRKTHSRPYVHRRYAKSGNPTWSANVRNPDLTCTYIGTAGSREEAIAIAEHFIATGERPPARTRGRKYGQRDCSPRHRTPMNPREPRCQAVAPKREGKVPTTALTTAHAPRETPRSPAAGALTYDQRMAMMRQIARRLG